MNENKTKKREISLQNFIRTLNSKIAKRLSNEVYKRIMPCGSRAGVMYGLPKIHKSGVPVRPFISAVNTYKYGLAKYLFEILTSLVDAEFILKDTYDFVNRVKGLNFGSDKYMVSFDVETLFTNVPTLETIEIILDLAYKDSRLFHELKREELKKFSRNMHTKIAFSI